MLLTRTEFPGPRAFDASLLDGLRPGTRSLYLAAVQEFHAFMIQYKVPVHTLSQVDEAIVMYWRLVGGPPSRLERLLAALERLWPQLKGHTPWAHAQVRRSQGQHPVNHTVPLTWTTALAVATWMAHHGHARVGGLLLLQWCYGLRPGEALGLCGGHLILPHVSGNGPEPVVLLGIKRRTKASRRQFVIADSSRTPWALVVTKTFAQTTGPETPLTAITSVNHYSRLIKQACRGLALATTYTGHSARAGWATAMRLRGMAFAELQEKGRWSHPRSLRIYLDVVSTIALTAEESHVTRWATYLDEDLEKRFPWWVR